jgi:TolB-like protein/DNA-binding winged helix-turn-helix (wHTH) protein/Tfp pilus assembly protein PilF
MGTNSGQAVPKDGRKKDEISSKSGIMASSMPNSCARPSIGDASGCRIRFDRYVLDLERGCLMAGDEEVRLRPKSFELLKVLARNPGRLVSKDELLCAVWPNVVVTEDSIVQCMTELRRALVDNDQRLIKTVPRRGYRFEVTPAVDLQTGRVREAATPVVEADKPALLSMGRSRIVGRHRTLVLVAMVTVAVFSVTMAWWWFSGQGKPMPAPPLSIAVLPFTNLSDDPDQAYFAEGVSSDLSTALSRLPGMFVIAHATARKFRGRDIDTSQVGDELNVRYLLDGSVRRTGNQIRINAQLVDTATGASVWAERFARKRDELSAWQDEVIGRIATSLNFRLAALESKRALLDWGDDPQARDLITRGWAMVYAAKKPRPYESAQALFQQALERNPRAVNALAGIGWTAAVSVLDGWSIAPAKDLTVAKAAVAEALALDPNHVVAHHVRGFMLRLEKRTNLAHDAFRTVVTINPNFAPGHAQLGATALELGRPEETVPAIKRAVRLSPRDPNLGPWFAIAGMAELHLGHYEEAVSWLVRAIDTGTPVALHQAYLAGALALAGREAEARAALADFQKAERAATITGLRAQAYSTELRFVAQRERLYEGLRMAGLPQ